MVFPEVSFHIPQQNPVDQSIPIQDHRVRNLPTEIVQIILSHLNLHSTLTTSLVCKRWRTASLHAQISILNRTKISFLKRGTGESFNQHFSKILAHPYSYEWTRSDLTDCFELYDPLFQHFLETATRLNSISLTRTGISMRSLMALLPSATNLRTLDLSGSTAAFSILNLPALTSLKVAQTPVKPQFFLTCTQMCQLKALNVKGCYNLTSLNFLSVLTQLEILNISHCHLEEADLENLKFVPNLKTLNISHLTFSITFLLFLRFTPRLTKLSFGNNPHLHPDTLNILQRVTNLTSLKIVFPCRVYIKDYLLHVPNLNTLKIARNECTELSFLQHVPSLTKLSIIGFKSLNPSSLQDLDNVTQLRSLDLTQCTTLTNFEPLKKLPHLRYVKADGTSLVMPPPFARPVDN